MRQVSNNLRRFRSQQATGTKLPFPAPSNLRLAQLNPAPLFDSVEPFTPERWVELEAYRPRVLVGRATELHRLAEQVELGMIDLSCVDHAIIALTASGDNPVSDILRVILWQTFGVPVFELYIGLDQSLLASECEAHEGWHLEPDVHVSLLHDELILDSPGGRGQRTGLTGTLDLEPCPCGRSTPRVLNIESIARPESERQLAAIA